MSVIKQTATKSTEPKIHNITNVNKVAKVPLPKITVTKNALATHDHAKPSGATSAMAAAVAAATIITVPSTATTTTTNPTKKKSLNSMSDEEIIQENLKEILEKKSREERKANGRLVVVIVAALVIFLTVYHAWIRKTGAPIGVLVPAAIMLSYGAWVVLLAKRDKHKRELFKRHIEEVALKNKAELEAKIRQKHAVTGKYDKASLASSSSSGQTTLHFENELNVSHAINHDAIDENRKKHRRRQRNNIGTVAAKTTTTQQQQQQQGAVTVHRSAVGRRPSIREKLFGTTMTHLKLLDVPSATTASDNVEQSSPESSSLAQKRKRLQRLDTLAMPQVVRMSSAP